MPIPDLASLDIYLQAKVLMTLHTRAWLHLRSLRIKILPRIRKQSCLTKYLLTVLRLLYTPGA